MLLRSALSASLICAATLTMIACSSDDDDTGDTNTADGSDTDNVTDNTTDNSGDDNSDSDADSTLTGNFDSTMFADNLVSSQEEACTLDSGTVTTCLRLTFTANGAGDSTEDGTIGPYCPDSIATPRDEAGFGNYDGPTTPGFQSLVDAAIAMEADGYDIIDDDGNIRSGGGGPDEDFSSCLDMDLVDQEVTFLIPIETEMRGTPATVGTVDSLGVTRSGVPLKGYPPSVTTAEEGVGGTGSGNIPALDHCGGHGDPQGYYHWHLIPEGVNTVLDSETYNYTADFGITCSNSTVEFDSPTDFSGLAKDGFPFYGPLDDVDGTATSPGEVATLDECNGHTHTNDEYTDGVYHYHALAALAPNIPPCLMGSFVEQDFIIGDGRP